MYASAQHSNYQQSAAYVGCTEPQRKLIFKIHVQGRHTWVRHYLFWILEREVHGPPFVILNMPQFALNRWTLQTSIGCDGWEVQSGAIALNGPARGSVMLWLVQFFSAWVISVSAILHPLILFGVWANREWASMSDLAPSPPAAPVNKFRTLHEARLQSC